MKLFQRRKRQSRGGRRGGGIADRTALAEVKRMLGQYKIQPDRRRGQNFLVDEDVYGSILQAACLTPTDTVLEIGAGLGTLTERLAAQVKRVVAVEIDQRLAAILRRRFADTPNVTVIAQDIMALLVSGLNLARPSAAQTPYAGALKQIHGREKVLTDNSSSNTSSTYKVVANIPYYITSQILKKFLVAEEPPLSLTLLVQKEVGERLVARPGAMSLLALSVQLYARPRLVRLVPRASFFPPPAVDSALVVIDGVHAFPFRDVPEKFFWRVARVGFAARRKQLHNNLAAVFRLTAAQAQAALADAGIHPRARAQDLDIQQWHRLSVALFSWAG